MKTPVFVIAEVGINHNGDVKIAKQLIDAAKFAGANAVKFQKRTIDRVYSKEYLNGERKSSWGNTQRAQKEGLEFGKEEYDEIDRYCKEKGMKWFASAWDIESIRFLKQYYSITYNKIASPLLTHKEILNRIARQHYLTYISTGMSTMEEITNAVKIFDDNQCDFILMHCNSQYPMPDKLANLRVMNTLQEAFKGSKHFKGVGYSGHEVGLIVSVAAVACGAIAIERHITLDRSLYGSDQASSIEPMGLYKLVKYIRAIENALGDGVKTVSEVEEKAKSKLRRGEDIITTL